MHGSTKRDREAAAGHGLALAVLCSPAPLAAEWRALAERMGASVYQRIDWIECWLATAAKAQAIRPAIVTIRLKGRLAAILPLGIERVGPLRIARFLGGEHANIRMPLADPELAAQLADAPALLAAVAAALRGQADLLDLDALPKSWNGHDVPLANHPAAVAARLPVGSLRLDPDFGRILDPKRRAKKAKKHRAQVNALAAIGGYRFVKAGSAAEANALLDRFLADKAAWFEQRGLDNSFAPPGIVPFFRALIERRWQTGAPLIELYGVEFAGSVHAVFAGGAAGGRLSGYFLSVADDEWRRITPGELLIHDVVADGCVAGLTALDLGRGDERYKTSWLETTETHVRLLAPVSPLGRLAHAWLRGLDAAERRVRASPRLFALARRARHLLARRRPGADEAD